MPSAIDRIRSKNKIVATAAAAATSAEIAKPLGNPFVRNLPKMTPEIEQLQQPAISSEVGAITTPTLPTPLPCLICECPAVWSSIYEPNVFRCCDCDPPPGGNDPWHFQRGGWAFVGRRMMIVVWPGAVTDPETGTTTLADKPEWESFPRIDWAMEMKELKKAESAAAA